MVESEHSSPMILPQPTATSWRFETMPANDGSLIVELTINHILGETVIYLPHDMAKEIGRKLVEYAAQARSGLIVERGPAHGVAARPVGELMAGG